MLVPVRDPSFGYIQICNHFLYMKPLTVHKQISASSFETNSSLQITHNRYIHIYTSIYVCVCVCVCVEINNEKESKSMEKN